MTFDSFSELPIYDVFYNIVRLYGELCAVASPQGRRILLYILNCYFNYDFRLCNLCYN